MADQKRVLITHPDGREYGIPERGFTDPRLFPRGVGSYADQGFRIVSYENGASYDGPKTKHEIEKAAEQRQASRAADKPAPKSKGA